MGVSTTTAAVHITPVVIKTFLNHYRKKTKKNAHYYVTAKEKEEWEDDAKDQLIFDEAFHIVKAFIELGTQNSIESLQAFTNTHIPSPYWVAVAPVLIPLQTCNRAADVLVEWFGPEDLQKVVGGERWWQVRGLDGVEGEWITEKTFLGELDKKSQKHKTETDELIGKMDHLEPVMFYVHGGGYFWGSINTHRYQTIRYAKKMKGRCFMVNYRKAPQYPWPCPIHDVLAAYLYLIDPPADAPHQPVSPSKIVFAGDSAGGALCLSVLTVLRDMGIPLPAGAVLISPWVDLTHSFESVMTNTKTDIIPPHGFVHKPSMLWPVRPLADEDNPRLRETQTNVPPPPGHADTLDPSPQRVEEQEALRDEARQSNISMSAAEARHASTTELKSQDEMLHDVVIDSRDLTGETTPGSRQGTSDQSQDRQDDGDGGGGNELSEEDLDRWEPKPPKVLMNDPNAVPLEVLSQIQQYATNEQLSHPLVSPILQGSLCNLCPLYFIAGNGEVLRDEILHVAHRAAHPTEYPVRKGILKEGHRQRENVDKFTTPTKVHLQLYDDMPHVLTVFTFAACAKYAYRAIAQFARHVTIHPPEHIERNPFPELHRPECAVHFDRKPGPSNGDDEHGERWGFCCTGSSFGRRKPAPTSTGDAEEDLTGIKLYKENERQVAEQIEEHGQEQAEAEEGHSDQPGEVARQNERVPAAQEEDIPHILMIRERVDIHGRVRKMEPAEDISALRIKPSTVGLIKEAPVLRWHAGQEGMDRKYAAHARRVIHRRKKMEERVERMIVEAYEQGLIHADDTAPESGPSDNNGHARTQSEGSAPPASATPSGLDSEGPLRPKRKTVVRIASTDAQMSTFSVDTVSGSVKIDEFRRWGPLDLENERPPPSAIAGRRDTVEALALIKRHIYHTAPITHKTVPKMKASHVVRSALDPHDRVSTKPMQSVSEEQTRSKMNPMHGLSIWGSLVSYFMRKTSHTVADNVRDGVDNVLDGVGNVRDGVRNIGNGTSQSDS